MKIRTTSAATAPSVTAATDTHLYGRWLRLARVGWVAVVGLALTLFLASLPGYFAESETVCRTAACKSYQLTPAGVQHLHALGLSLDFFAWYALVVTCLFVVSYMTVGLLIFWRKAADRTALVAAVALLTFPISFTNLTNALPAFWWLPAHIVRVVGALSMFLLFYVFPDGCFVPRWTRWLWAGGMICIVASDVFPSALLNRLVGQYVVSILVTSLVAVQIYRYVRVSTPVQRQQTKWVVLGFTVAALGYPITVGPHRNLPSLYREGTLPSLIGFGLTYLLFLLIPLSIGVAIFRYRLWDLHVLIKKALVYGLLTGLLGVLYAGLIIGLQALVGAVNSSASHSPVIIVASTLLIAALFDPVRRRIQATIDRRFYRRKYDAARTLATFGATLRTETNLAQLTDRLVTVVQETMQPAHVSLWLRTPDKPTSTGSALASRSIMSEKAPHRAISQDDAG